MSVRLCVGDEARYGMVQYTGTIMFENVVTHDCETIGDEVWVMVWYGSRSRRQYLGGFGGRGDMTSHVICTMKFRYSLICPS